MEEKATSVEETVWAKLILTNSVQFMGRVQGDLKRKDSLKSLKIVRTKRKGNHSRLIWIFAPVGVSI